MAFLRDELSCSICLSLYTDPVMLVCGHNFCRECIEQAVDNHGTATVFTCPECRTEFQQRPALLRNLKLSNILEHLCARQPEQQQETNVLCTYCEFDTAAVKSCLRCETFLCDNHLQKHNKSLEHLLSEPSAFLKDRKCLVHQERLKYYCPQDAICVCALCCEGGLYQGHPVESLPTASQKKLQDALLKLTGEREKLEDKVKQFKEQRRKVQEKADTLRRGIKAFFTKMMKEIKLLQKTVLSEISRKKSHAFVQVAGLIQETEVKKNELSKKIYQTEELLHLSDPLTVLREVSEAEEDHQVQDITVFVDEMPIQLVLHQCLSSLIDMSVQLKENIPTLESSHVLLDIKTACNYIFVSDDSKSASYVQVDQGYLDGPERFQACQVFSMNSFTSGQSYWEVDISKAKEWIVGVAYNSMERKTVGNDSYIGYNDKSWGMEYRNTLTARHNDITVDVMVDSPIQLLGVYINMDAGLLSFYQLSDPIRHLYTFTASFTEDLHAAFYLFPGSCISVQ
ncbi:E3 ubiquitin/ISG15 ligase TRIM25-like [Hyperolius riggenbachi]|uniref:E3 ubiquitin/ISG15 ligase TRIM25-like n=1 Tax=Hyperolius riggenbachi TaxID=752182 RepID=UPI0035A2F65B